MPVCLLKHCIASIRGWKALLMEDINVGLNFTASSPYTSEILLMLQSNAFSDLITKPTQVLKTSQIIIAHILSNNSESIITPKEFLHKISDYFSIICTNENPKFKAPKP